MSAYRRTVGSSAMRAWGFSGQECGHGGLGLDVVYPLIGPLGVEVRLYVADVRGTEVG